MYVRTYYTVHVVLQKLVPAKLVRGPNIAEFAPPSRIRLEGTINVVFGSFEVYVKGRGKKNYFSFLGM